MAGNQLGKTWGGGAETAMHLTGLYPDWWDGRRYTKAIRAWAAGETNTTTRDKVQLILLGPKRDYGSGWIPKDTLVGEPASARSIAGAVDYFEVAHISGGISWCKLKSYEQTAETFESDSIDFLWLDEEPPVDHHTAALARTTQTDGSMIITFTPLLGQSEVVDLYYPRPTTTQRCYIMMEVSDCVKSKGGHIEDHRVAEIVAKYPAHQREARARGIPMLGSGKVYQIEEALIEEDPVEVSDYWPRLAGLDLGGGEHPTAVVWLAWDKDADVIHLYDAYRTTDAMISTHASAIKTRGSWIPVAYPHDAHIQDRGTGEEYANLYRLEGVTMLWDHATHETTEGFAVEPGITSLENRMRRGGFKVARHLLQWWEEYRTYHREKGLIVKRRDDLMDATRYAHMMRRHAKMRPREFSGQHVQMADYDVWNPGGRLQ